MALNHPKSCGKTCLSRPRICGKYGFEPPQIMWKNLPFKAKNVWKMWFEPPKSCGKTCPSHPRTCGKMLLEATKSVENHYLIQLNILGVVPSLERPSKRVWGTPQYMHIHTENIAQAARCCQGTRSNARWRLAFSHAGRACGRRRQQTKGHINMLTMVHIAVTTNMYVYIRIHALISCPDEDIVRLSKPTKRLISQYASATIGPLATCCCFLAPHSSASKMPKASKWHFRVGSVLEVAHVALGH